MSSQWSCLDWFSTQNSVCISDLHEPKSWKFTPLGPLLPSLLKKRSSGAMAWNALLTAWWWVCITQHKTLNNGIREKGRVFGENTWLCVNRRSKHAACLHPGLTTWGEFLERPTQPWKPHCETECKLLCDMRFLQPSFRQRSSCVLGCEGSFQRPGLVIILTVDIFEHQTKTTNMWK